jgi:hypothetical protein
MKYSLDDKRPLSKYKRFMADKYERYEVIPFWKGFVCRDYERQHTRVSIVGFALVFRIVYNIWLYLRIVGIDTQEFYKEQIKYRCRK